MNNKEKIRQMVQQGSNTTNFSYTNPGYSCDPYFGASSFYGDQCRQYNYKFDYIRKDNVWFIPRYNKALGRQTMLN
jgi:hypothetical protein